MNWKYLWCLLRGHKWYYDHHIRGCLKCGWLELVSTYPFKQKGSQFHWDWIPFPEDLDEYTKEPSDEKAMSEELFRFLDARDKKL